jgi:hypothetical protein
VRQVVGEGRGGARKRLRLPAAALLLLIRCFAMRERGRERLTAVLKP